jgi:hypothetical protein
LKIDSGIDQKSIFPIMNKMEPWTRSHPEREFSAEIKREERKVARNACRICGRPRDLIQLQFAHIYTHSQHPTWERMGSDPKKWANDKYVSSFANCLLLCKPCHGKIDSTKGRELCTVRYLESLKADQKHCTALIQAKKNIRRCQKTNSGAKGDGYHCHLHPDGGLESDLIPRKGWGGGQSKPDKQPTPAPQKKESCIIL